MDVPDSLCEVVLSFCLLVAVHTALKQLVDFASDMLDVPDQPKASGSAGSAADDDGPDGTRQVLHALASAPTCAQKALRHAYYLCSLT